MKKDWIIRGLFVLFIVLLIGSVLLLINKQIFGFIILFSICIISFVGCIFIISSNKSKAEDYEIKINNILRIYGSVLVKSKNYPDLSSKNIIVLENIEDLVDAQLEIRKPIYYVKHVESCSFILLDNKEALVLTLKKDENELCGLDIILKDIETINKQKDRKASQADDLLKDIDKTTILKLDKNKSYKVIPVVKNEDGRIIHKSAVIDNSDEDVI